jgi:adenosylhomocysteine nucleosidase
MKKLTPKPAPLIAACFIVIAFAVVCLAQNPIAILGAFEEELTWLQEKVESASERQILGYQFTTGEIEGHNVVLALTGVGKVNAAAMTILMIEHFQPEAILFSGVAGGLNPDLLPGDIVIGKRTVQHDLGDITPTGMDLFGVRSPITWKPNPVFFGADSTLLELAQKAITVTELEKITTSMGERTPRAIIGIIATGDAFMTSTPKKQELNESLSADAVEMEGAAVAQICYQMGIPCLIVRALSDKSDENAMVDFEKFYPVAARNANRVILTILSYLDKSGHGTIKSYRDLRYGFQFDYPAECKLKTSTDPNGGLIFSTLKDTYGTDLITIQTFDLSSYPRDVVAREAATFPAAAVYISKLISSADGPDGSRYCSAVEITESFVNGAGIPCLELSLKIVVEDYNQGTEATEIKSPVFMADLSHTGAHLILIIDPFADSPSADETARQLINSLK